MTALTDLRALIANMSGAGIAVFGAYSSPCLLRYGGAVIGDEGMAQLGMGTVSLLYAFPDLPGVVPGSAIAVDGVSYVAISAPRRSADGLEGVVSLQDAT